jgi:tetratricopeptide (TPR) repeat protein
MPWSALLRTYAQGLHVAALIEEERGNPQAADNLFQKALDQVRRTGYEELLHEINFSYGETLSRRGAHEQAVEYYRDAARPRSRSARLGT